MEPRKLILHETTAVAIGQAVGIAVMLGIFALLKRFDLSVLLGGLAGGLLALLNFFLMSLFANLAADKAEAQDVAGGQKIIQLSYMGRMIGLALILILCAKSGMFHLLALVIPLLLTRPILTVKELIFKKGGKQA